MTEAAQDLLDSSSTSRLQIQLLRRGEVPDGTGGDMHPHILLAVDQFPRALGGGERVLLRLADLLPQRGFRVSILTLGVHSESAVFKLPVNAPIYLLPLRRTYGVDAIRAAFELRRFLREQRVALVQTFFESSDLWVGPVAKLMSPAKLIWSRRDMGILRANKHRIAYRMLRSLPDEVFAVSEQVRQHVLQVDGVDPTRVETIYNGIDPTPWFALAPHQRRAGEFKIVTVGNVRRVKGHDVLIRAAAELRRDFPGAQVQIAGEILDQDYFLELQNLIRELGLGDRVIFAGGVSDLCGFLGGADLFVLPSRSEGFSNAIVEAMAAGLPVVASDVGGNAEAVLDGKTGRIVPPDDADALAAAMRQFLADPEMACQMGAAGRARVAERFTSDAMIGQVTAAYRRLLRPA